MDVATKVPPHDDETSPLPFDDVVASLVRAVNEATAPSRPAHQPAMRRLAYLFD